MKTPPFGLEGELFDSYLKKEKVKQDTWIAGPAFWWPHLKADEKLNELFFRAKDRDWADVVFCEDCSTFLEFSSKNGDTTPAQFSAEFEGSWGNRYVASLKGVRYAPRSRFAV